MNIPDLDSRPREWRRYKTSFIRIAADDELTAKEGIVQPVRPANGKQVRERANTWKEL